MTLCNIEQNIEKTKMYIQQHLIPIIKDCGEKLEGNLFYNHNQHDYSVWRNDNLVKAINLSNLASNHYVKDAMEIGFNAGFSALLMLISNPNLTLTCYDIAIHSYTIPCFEKIKDTFGNRITLIIGDSTKTLKYSKDLYDLIHIDGGHEIEIASQDIEHSYKSSKPNTIFIFDDYQCDYLKHIWDQYVLKYSLRDISWCINRNIYHDIKIR